MVQRKQEAETSTKSRERNIGGKNGYCMESLHDDRGRRQSATRVVVGYDNSSEQVHLGRRNDEHLARNMILSPQHSRKINDRAVTVITEVRNVAEGNG